MRRLPIFLVVDVSESMVGENIRLMQNGLDRLFAELQANPYALELCSIEIIAFAGQAKVLSPMISLMEFEMPELPLGSGTSIGAALNLIMDRIDSQIVNSNDSQKGDYRPLIYFMTDGAGTDNAKDAIKRWKNNKYNLLSKFISIGIGKYANLSLLQEISDLSYRVNTDDNNHNYVSSLELAYKTLIDSIQNSVLTQARSVGMGKDIRPEVREGDGISLVKENNASGVDENYAIFVGKCSKKKLPYIIKYERFDILSNDFPKNFPVDLKQDLENLTNTQKEDLLARQPDGYYFYAGIFAVNREDFEDWSDNSDSSRSVKGGQLMGFTDECPHCANDYSMSVHSCGKIKCRGRNEKSGVCPHCGGLWRVYPPKKGSSGGGSSWDDFSVGTSKG